MSKRKILAVAAAVVAMVGLAATYFGSVTVVSTMHATTNGIHITLGEHQASVVRKISPSNLVAVQNTVLLPRTNLNGLTVVNGLTADIMNVNTQSVGSLYVSNSVAYYASAATIIIDCTYSQLHVISNTAANNMSIILSNYAVAGRDWSLKVRPSGTATNNSITLSLSGAGVLDWLVATNSSVKSNRTWFASGLTTDVRAGDITNVVVSQQGRTD